MRRRHRTQTQAAPPGAPLLRADGTAQPARRGLIPRARARVVRRTLTRALSNPAAAPLVAVAVIAVFAALALGVLIGATLAQRGSDQ